MAIATEQSKGIGQAVHRKEDKKLLTGKGRYVDDLKLPGMQHMAVVRSPHAHADITGFDTSKAKAMPGVTAVLTGDDLEFAAGVPCASNPTGDMVHPVRPPLAKGRVRHAGEPVAVVIATDRYTAADAAAAVEVSYNPLPALVTPEAALADGAPKIHEELDSNVALVLAHKTDGVDEAFADADVVVKHTIRNQRLIHVPIETRGVVADWNTASDELVVYSSTQVPHFLRTFLAIVCGVSEAKVRAIAPDVGGGFGSKLNAYAEEFIAAAASRKVGAPVKWIEERSEAMVATCHGRAQDATMELAATKDGKVLAMRVHYVQDYGSYLQMLTPLISQLTLLMSPGAYAIPEVDVTVTNVYTNTVPTDALRGAGRPEATHAIERMMDILALELGMSRTEIRRKNFPQEFPFTTAIGLMYDSGDYDKTLDKLLELSDSKDEFEKRRVEAASRGKLLGRGLSTWVEVCGFVPSDVARSALGLTPGGWESSTVRMHPTGKVTVITGTSPHGQGHATSWSQIIETELGIPFDDVEVIHGDTAFAPYGLGTYGSRSLAVGGTAVHLAATQVRDKARLVAAQMLEASSDDLEFSGGTFSVKGSPDKSVTMQEVAFRAWQAFNMPEGVTPGLDETVFFDPPNCVFPFGAHGCEVEVDKETGKVEITGYIAVDDCGNVINPAIVAGQVHGGVVHGIGQALYEGAVYDDERPAPHRVAGRVRHPVGGGGSVDSDAPHGDAVADEPARREGDRRGGHDRIDAGRGRRRVRRARRPRHRHAAPAGDGVARDAGRRPGVIPQEFDYEHPSSVADAIAMLGKHGGEARILAGGHSLVPLMKLRLAAPDALIDIGGIASLRGITDTPDSITIGALTTHAQVAASDVVAGGCPILAETAAGIGDSQVRNRGTIGGSLANADPHGDLPAVFLALDGEVTAEGPGGQRTIAAADLFVDYLQTSLSDGRDPDGGAGAEGGQERVRQVQPACAGLGGRRRGGGRRRARRPGSR